jgi:hypothetical protein
MAKFCFSERKRELFGEAFVRGWVAAIQDFPHLKNSEESTAQSMAECDALKSEVCCITDENAYRTLVSSAWVNTYKALSPVSERLIVLMVSVLRAMPNDEALAFVRSDFVSDVRQQAEIDRAYAQFLSALDEGGK